MQSLAARPATRRPLRAISRRRCASRPCRAQQPGPLLPARRRGFRQLLDRVPARRRNAVVHVQCGFPAQYRKLQHHRCSLHGPYGILGGDIAQCPDQTAPPPNGCSVGVPIFGGPAGSATCTSFTWDPVAGVSSNVSSPPGTTLLQDSNNLGVVCRHNNQVVRGQRRSGWPDPPRSSIRGRTLGDVYAANKTGHRAVYAAGASSSRRRPAAARRSARRSTFRATTTRSTPSSSATTPIITVNGQWKGFGTGRGCKTGNDLTHLPERQVRPVPSRRPHQRRPHVQLRRPGDAAAGVAHLRAGDRQLRELVRLLPAARARGEDHVRAVVQPARQHLSRRLPHAGPEPADRTRSERAPLSGSTSTISTRAPATRRISGGTRCSRCRPSPPTRRRRFPRCCGSAACIETGGAGGLPAPHHAAARGRQGSVARMRAANSSAARATTTSCSPTAPPTRSALPTVAGRRGPGAFPGISLADASAQSRQRFARALHVAMWPPPFRQGAESGRRHAVRRRHVLLGARSTPRR